MARAFHPCRADGCQRRIYAHLLMCVHHWRMVPPGLRRQVWSHYKPGQEKAGGPAPSDAYFAAVEAACMAVREKAQL